VERRRVVVTGLGIVSQLGNSVEASWDALLSGGTSGPRLAAGKHSGEH
jgi:3-oxoacyl-(acyl-carrier-protein) synthase